MIEIPGQSKKYSVPNNSDLFGSLHYTKNINLDEDGYLKLSSRTVSIFNQKDTSNVRLPVAFGRKSDFYSVPPSVEFALTQAGQKGYWLILQDTGDNLNVDIGTNAPTLTTDSHGCWFQNLWTVTDDTELYTKADVTDVATYTARSASLTSGKVHFVEVFRNRNTVCVTNGNTVKQFNTSYSASTTLTLPTDYEAIGLSYSNNKMGVIAMLSDTAQGQNQEAYFFVWDGASTSASAGIPIGTDKIIAIRPFIGSWVILTSNGKFRFYNGGGWDDTLPALPFYYQQLYWGDSYTRDILGDCTFGSDDLIYFNNNGLLKPYGTRYEKFLPNNMGGILCLDPKIGIYNRYTPSISTSSIISVTSANVNTTTDVLTTAGTVPSTGSPIKYISDKSNHIGGLTTPTIYYCIKLSATTFNLATSKENAIAGIKIDLTSTGASTNYFMGLEVYDYGQSYATTTGAIAEVGEVTPTHDHLIFGSNLNDFDSTNDYVHLNVTVPDFENRGYAVTPKIESSQISDIAQKIFIKYRPLDTNDKIIAKVKTKDVLGLPVTTPQARVSTNNQCVWSGADTFYTTNGVDLSDAKTAFDAGVELECEIIAGAGAGSMAKILDISYDSSTNVYSVQLEEDIDGAASTRYCDIKIENWTVLDTITTDDADGFKEIPIGETTPWYKFKIELRGSNTTIEKAQIINTPQQLAQ